MAEQIGFIVNETPEWLDATADCRVRGLSQQEAFNTITPILAEKYKAIENIQKTRSILMTIWYKGAGRILDMSEQSFLLCNENQRVAIHYALMLSNYAIFYDVCFAVGKVLERGDTVSTTQVNKTVYLKWGERSIVGQAVTKTMRTHRDMGLLTEKRQGVFTAQNKISITDRTVAAILVASVIKQSGIAYMQWNSLLDHPALFPFDIARWNESDFADIPGFELSRFDGNIVMSFSNEK